MTDKKILKRIDELEKILCQTLWKTNDNYDKLNIILAILIVIGLGLACYIVILFMSSDLSSNHYSKEDYCDEKYGQGSYYNSIFGDPHQVGRCEFTDINGSLVIKYFTDDDYKLWRDGKNG